jgi:hypothetical protein
MRTIRSGERQQALPGGEPVASRPRAAVLGGKIRAEH